MVESNFEVFEQFVKDGIAAIPEQFRKQLDNVSFQIEDIPNGEQRQKLQLRQGHTLFGLYEGVPLTRRGSAYYGVLPDTITIFRLPMEHYARDLEHLRELVKNTIWHEVGHYFGMDEDQVRQAERNRGHKY